MLLETSVDPQRFQGTVYQAANWRYLGNTQGFQRMRGGYGDTPDSPKKVFVKALQAEAQTVLARPYLDPPYRTGTPKLMLSAEQMVSLPAFFANIPDPRRAQGRRYPLPVVLAIAAGAILCGMRGYKVMADWAKSLRPKARKRFHCRRVDGSYRVPSAYIIRDCLIRVDPADLDRALQRWNQTYGARGESLVLDGKTLRNALADQGRHTHRTWPGKHNPATPLRYWSDRIQRRL